MPPRPPPLRSQGVPSRPESARPLPQIRCAPQTNFIHLSKRGNLTFDSLVLDNLAWGDEESVRDVKARAAPARR